MIITKTTSDKDGFIHVSNAVRFLNFRIIDNRVVVSAITDPVGKSGRELTVVCKRDGDSIKTDMIPKYFATLSDDEDNTFHLFEYDTKINRIIAKA